MVRLSEEVNVETHGAHEEVDVLALLHAELLREDFGGLDVFEDTVSVCRG
jgi:hypothetical protein